MGLGARCLTCGEKRRRVLKSVALFGGWKPLCFNCAGQLLVLDPLPTTIPALKAAVSRERRRQDRRIGKPDTRVFRYERRVGERRMVREDCPLVDDDMIIEVTVELDPEVDFDDLTQIRDLMDLREAV